jgi:hypothetical protein
LSSQQQIVDVRVLKISLEGTVGCRGHGSNHSQALSTCRIQITIINGINPVVVDTDSLNQDPDPAFQVNDVKKFKKYS